MSIGVGRIRGVQHLWTKRWIALLAVLNLCLVWFDLTYLNARSVYLQIVPSIVKAYDPIKGIHPHPETQRYLERVAALESQIAQTQINSPEVAVLLADLRSESQRLLEDNPFASERGAALETIQQVLQARTAAESPFVAFDRFWNQDYLAQAGWPRERAFWQEQIQPLLAANYYHQINRFGQEVDYFWLIDLPFVLIFAIDFIIRNRAIRQRHPELNWLESALRRWYDLLLLLPFWRWLRVLPVAARLNQVGWLNLEPFRAEAQRDLAIGFAKDLTKLVGIQAIEQVQASIQRGDVMQWLLYPELRPEYVQVNEVNELQAVTTHVADIIVRQVLPEVRIELETVLRYSLQQIFFDQLPGYRQLRFVPGIKHLPRQTADRLTKDLSERAYQSLIQVWEDPEAAEITTQLVQRFRAALATELKKKHNVQEIEALLIDMLEEIKINYVKGISEVGAEQMVDKVEQFRYQSKT
jgi:hypothetical protein